MTDTDLQDLSTADRAFALAARGGLRASECLNYVESARLAATRAQARALLEKPRFAMPAWGWLAAPAALAVISLSVLRMQSPAPAAGPLVSPDVFATVNASSADALMWVSDEAGPDFYRDLEFYEWLQSRSPAEPNA